MEVTPVGEQGVRRLHEEEMVPVCCCTLWCLQKTVVCLIFQKIKERILYVSTIKKL